MTYNTSASPLVVAGIVPALYIWTGLIATRRTGAHGRKQWMMAGSLTYPLYLIHQYVGCMFFNRTYSALGPHVDLVAMLALAIGSVCAVHLGVERPLAARMRAGPNALCDRPRRATSGPSATQ